MEPKSNHQVKVVRIEQIEQHPNADTLAIVRIGGYQVVVKLGQFQPGDLGYYIQPDSVVPQEEPYAFLWADNEFPDDIVPEKRRRITVRRFRKEWSEGMLMPCLQTPIGQWWVTRNGDGLIVDEGDDVAEHLGITHYEPPEPESRFREGHYPNYVRGVWPRSLKGWWYFLLYWLGFKPNGNTGGVNEKAPSCFPPVYDVEAYKNFSHAFLPGEPVFVTEKIHGSNARYVYENGKMYAGSRRLWKSPKAKCIWREVLNQHPWVEEWCRKHEGYTLYGEVVPTQSYSDGTTVSYGTEGSEVGFFVFDVRMPDGKWMPFVDVLADLDIKHTAPVLLVAPFDEKQITDFVDGDSVVPNAKHIREGVVIRPVEDRQIIGLGRLQLKIVSNAFLARS